MRRSLVLLGVLSLTGCGQAPTAPAGPAVADSVNITLLAQQSLNQLHYTMLFEYGYGGPQIQRSGVPTDGREAPPLTLTARFLQMVDAPGLAAIPSLASLVGPTLSAGACTTTVTGVDADGLPIDTDGDGIPDDYSVDWGAGCTYVTGNQRTIIGGYYRVRDLPIGLRSYEVTADSLVAKGSGPNGREHWIYFRDGVETFTATADSAVSTVRREYQNDSWNAVGQQENGLQFSVDQRSTFIPSAPWADPATMFPVTEGTLEYSATYHMFRLEGLDLSLTTTTPLFTPDGHAFNSGSLLGVINGDSTVGFTVNYVPYGYGKIEIFGAVP